MGGMRSFPLMPGISLTMTLSGAVAPMPGMSVIGRRGAAFDVWVALRGVGRGLCWSVESPIRIESRDVPCAGARPATTASATAPRSDRVATTSTRWHAAVEERMRTEVLHVAAGGHAAEHDRPGPALTDRARFCGHENQELVPRDVALGEAVREGA